VKSASLVLLGVLSLGTVIPASAAGPDYNVARGDTLWDLSGRFWSEPASWPELWALNPQFRNPHIIYPGDPIFLQRDHAQMGPVAEDRVIRLPLERLTPPGGGEGSATQGAGTGAAAGAMAVPTSIGPATYRFARGAALDFISEAPIRRLGTVHNRHQIKVAYATGEDVEFDVAPGAPVKAGDRLSLIDDSTEVFHPVTGRANGYYVQVLGQLEVLRVDGSHGVGWLSEVYDSVEDGDGLMTYREPVVEMAAKPSPPGMEGLILRGTPGQILFSTDDLVFVDRGAQQGLLPGLELQIPVREGERDAQGVVNLRAPLARVLIVTVEDRTAAGVVVDSRAALEPGDRFASAPLSP
jgi:hypothetical protein